MEYLECISNNTDEFIVDNLSIDLAQGKSFANDNDELRVSDPIRNDKSNLRVQQRVKQREGIVRKYGREIKKPFWLHGYATNDEVIGNAIYVTNHNLADSLTKTISGLRLMAYLSQLGIRDLGGMFECERAPYHNSQDASHNCLFSFLLIRRHLKLY